MPVPKGQKGVGVEMHKFKAGTLHSGSPTGPIVKNRSQAIAIAMSEAGLSRRNTLSQGSRAMRDRSTAASPPMSKTEIMRGYRKCG
jgi:hypothetical protein